MISTKLAPVTSAAQRLAVETARLSDVTGYQLARAAASTRDIFFKVAGEPYDLRPVEYTALALIHENKGLSLARLAEALAVSAPNITVWVARLEKRGLVARKPHATDRRTQVLALTAAGQEAVTAATARLVAAERAAFDKLSRVELLMLNELLEKVATSRGGRDAV